MKKISSALFSLLLTASAWGQISQALEIWPMPEDCQETSGLLFFNHHIITHNDSDNAPELYELDSLTGQILRTVSVSGATNVDWEAIAMDEAFIYIGDIGNNAGNRDDLVIYKIAKNDFIENEIVEAEQIYFHYEDQLDFITAYNATAFDAEALMCTGNHLFIFTKNWISETTTVYQLGKSPGEHTAIPVGFFDTNGLVTGADYKEALDVVLLCGYSTSLSPFAFVIYGFESEEWIGTQSMKFILPAPFGFGSQVEAVALDENGQCLFSRESFVTTVAGFELNYEATMYSAMLSFEFTHVDETLVANSISVAPNPNDGFFTIESRMTARASFELRDALGLVFRSGYLKPGKTAIDISGAPSGTYFLTVDGHTLRVLKF
jgi:hypothetical protein